MRIKSSKTVKRIFLFFIFYLPFQYMLVGVIGVLHSEPWPTFTLPGFKKVYTTEDQSQIVKPVFYINLEDHEEDMEISASELFQGIQISQLQGFIRTNFSQPREFSDEAQHWFRQRIDQLRPDVSDTGMKVIWKRIIYEQSGDSVSVESGDTLKIIDIYSSDRP